MPSTRGGKPCLTRDRFRRTVQSAAVRACRDALHWRDGLRALFTSAGVPASLYDRYDIPGNSKAKIAWAVFSTLQDCGESGYALQRKVVEELCRMTKPSPDAQDQRAGKEALAELKREATAAKVLVDPTGSRVSRSTGRFTSGGSPIWLRLDGDPAHQVLEEPRVRLMIHAVTSGCRRIVCLHKLA